MRVDHRAGLTGAGALALVVLLAPCSAAAQEPIVPLQISFSDPGARSMGFGGAFVALADDATAALANPAGLVQLVTPEISVEGRQWRYSTPFVASGRVEGAPSGLGVDTRYGLETRTSKESTTGLSFVSLVYPRPPWSFAIYRHQLANFAFRAETEGLFGGGSNCCQTRMFDQRARADLDFVSYGISVGYRVSDELALGVGMTYHDVSLYSSATMYLPDADLPAGILGPTSYLPQRAVFTDQNLVDDHDWTPVAGLLWRPSRRWAVGAVYRRGARVGLTAQRTAGPAADIGVPTGGIVYRFSGVELQLPDVMGIGLAHRALDDRLTVSFQWDRVEYTSIVESLSLEDHTVNDANELHLGGEYVFLGSTPIVAVRLGAWFDPDHQLAANGDDPFVRALKPPGIDELHWTAGVGLAFEGFQVDLGVDLADRLDAVSLSIIFELR